VIYSLRAALVCAAAFVSLPAHAQDAAAPLRVQRAEPNAPVAIVLPANTKVQVQMNQEVTTKGKSWSEGDSFDMTVIEDVTMNGYLVIPRGSRATGHISWLTDKGMFGKSGKLEVELDYVHVGDRRVPITGSYRQEGEGNTVATVAGVLAAGPFAAVVTGRSGVIPEGRELTAYTKEDLPLAINGSAPTPAPRAEIVAARVS
jgi:hypothetical protein